MKKILFWLGIIFGVLISGGFFLISIFLLPAIAPDDFDEFIEDWKWVARDLEDD